MSRELHYPTNSSAVIKVNKLQCSPACCTVVIKANELERMLSAKWLKRSGWKPHSLHTITIECWCSRAYMSVFLLPFCFIPPRSLPEKMHRKRKKIFHTEKRYRASLLGGKCDPEAVSMPSKWCVFPGFSPSFRWGAERVDGFDRLCISFSTGRS